MLADMIEEVKWWGAFGSLSLPRDTVTILGGPEQGNGRLQDRPDFHSGGSQHPRQNSTESRA